MRKELTSSVFAALLVILSCSSSDSYVDITYLKMNVTTLTLAIGDNYQLEVTSRPADAAITVKWTSSAEDVVSVSDDGLITVLATGSATVTARYRSYSATCTVSTDDPLDFSAALGASLSDDIIYSKNVILSAPNNIMQGFDLASDGSIYYSQVTPTPSTMYVCRAMGPNEAPVDYMTFTYFGHGTQISVEEADDGTYIWLNSNASILSDGSYGNNWSFSRVKYEAGATYSDGYAGDTWFLNSDNEYDVQVSIDWENRLLLVGSRHGSRYFRIYDLDEALALPLKSITTSVTIDTYGSDTVTRTILARDLSECTELAYFVVPAGSDTETDVYSYSHQGHEIYGSYVYFYEGNAVSSGSNYASKAYVTTFNYSGDIVVARTSVDAITDNDILSSYDMTTVGYAEGESIKIRDRKLYLGIACRNSSGNRKANILVYEVE